MLLYLVFICLYSPGRISQRCKKNTILSILAYSFIARDPLAFKRGFLSLLHVAPRLTERLEHLFVSYEEAG